MLRATCTGTTGPWGNREVDTMEQHPASCRRTVRALRTSFLYIYIIYILFDIYMLVYLFIEITRVYDDFISFMAGQVVFKHYTYSSLL